MTDSPTLCLDRVGHHIGERCLFHELSASFRPGSVTAVIGRNGSGKTTLLRRLAGLEAPQRGSVRLGDQPISELTARERARRIAYLPQQPPLYHDLDVRELVLLGRAPHLGRWGDPKPDDLDVVSRALARVELGELAARKLSTLSGGERQRAMLARMLATGAPVLILDEPCAALDIAHALAFLKLARELASAMSTVVIAIHDLELVRNATDELLCLGTDADGSAQAGKTSEILTPQLLERAFDVRAESRGGFAFELLDRPEDSPVTRRQTSSDED
jgi:iron complex transport system ATP-binding protein